MWLYYNKQYNVIKRMKMNRLIRVMTLSTFSGVVSKCIRVTYRCFVILTVYTQLTFWGPPFSRWFVDLCPPDNPIYSGSRNLRTRGFRVVGGICINIYIYTLYYIHVIETADIQIYCSVKKLGDKNTFIPGTGYILGWYRVFFSDLYK